MARNNFNNFSGYQLSPHHQFMGDPLRNPYEQKFRTPHGFPPRPRESPAAFSPRQHFSSNRLKRTFPQSSADNSFSHSPNWSPYSGNLAFQHGSNVSPYVPYNPNSPIQHSPDFSSNSGNLSFQRSPSMTSSPSPYARNSSGFGNQSSFSPKNAYRRQNHRTDRDSNPGGSTDIREYYSPSIVSDPWKDLKPSRMAPLDNSNH